MPHYVHDMVRKDVEPPEMQVEIVREHQKGPHMEPGTEGKRLSARSKESLVVIVKDECAVHRRRIHNERVHQSKPDQSREEDGLGDRGGGWSRGFRSGGL